MTLSDQEVAEPSAAAHAEWWSGNDALSFPDRQWTAKRWLKVLLLVGFTLAAIIGLIVWLPSAFASGAGGCGGG
jgi:hypothetical protein